MTTTTLLDWIKLDETKIRWDWWEKITTTRICAVDSKIFKKIDYFYFEDSVDNWIPYEEISDICFCMSDDNEFIWEDEWDYTDLILKYLNK